MGWSGPSTTFGSYFLKFLRSEAIESESNSGFVKGVRGDRFRV